MEALEKVFETFKKVLDIIKKFFEDIFPQKDAEDAEGDANADA